MTALAQLAQTFTQAAERFRLQSQQENHRDSRMKSLGKAEAMLAAARIVREMEAK